MSDFLRSGRICKACTPNILSNKYILLWLSWWLYSAYIFVTRFVEWYTNHFALKSKCSLHTNDVCSYHSAGVCDCFSGALLDLYYCGFAATALVDTAKQQQLTGWFGGLHNKCKTAFSGPGNCTCTSSLFLLLWIAHPLSTTPNTIISNWKGRGTASNYPISDLL